MFLVAIEGDNGTGKDTAGALLQRQGFHISNYDVEAVEASKKARQTGRREQTAGFLKYGEICAEIAARHEKSLIIRYWMSTVAAAYSDGVFTWEEALEKATELLKRLPSPACVFYLTCDFNKRIDRINHRDPTSSDDRTSERAKRYASISAELAKLFNHWYVIDTTNMSPEEELSEMQIILEKIELLSKCHKLPE
jgi:thymidylate kinase